MKNYSEETIKEIIGDDHVQSLFVKLEKAESKEDKKQQSEVEKKIIEKLKDITVVE